MPLSPPDTAPAGVVAAESVLQNPATLGDLLSVRAYVWFWIGRARRHASAVQIQAIALAWQVYAVARHSSSVRRSRARGRHAGPCAVPADVALALFAGDAADIYDRRTIMIGFVVQLCASPCSRHHLCGLIVIGPFYVVPRCSAARRVRAPSGAALPPPWSSGGSSRAPSSSIRRAQIATIVGPALGGLWWFSTVALLSPSGAPCVFSLVALMAVACRRACPRPAAWRRALIAEGLSYVWTNKIVFGAISLDLFAVLLGGVTALLPVYARDILHIGPEGFGLLRSAPVGRRHRHASSRLRPLSATWA